MNHEKNAQRNTTYNNLIKSKISTLHYIGRIPDFKGSNKAADNLRSTHEWNGSRTIFVSPDTAQRKVRENVMLDKKILIMATPKIQDGYLIIKPENANEHEKEASTIEGAFKYGTKVYELPRVDLVVEGSVAVDLNGGRLGKGGGYGDREIEFLRITRSINTDTPIISTVHNLQIIETVPQKKHDQKINMIVTPEEIFRITKKKLIYISKIRTMDKNNNDS